MREKNIIYEEAPMTKWKKRSGQKKRCLRCGGPFIALSHNAKYCSECRESAYKELEKHWRKENGACVKQS